MYTDEKAVSINLKRTPADRQQSTELQIYYIRWLSILGFISLIFFHLSNMHKMKEFTNSFYIF